ncbi:MAG TPA: hypothetical protein VLG44_08215 [Chlamydiales bacterium]|nr:hypothetical protein [Chlamydiales bacterium]
MNMDIFFAKLLGLYLLIVSLLWLFRKNELKASFRQSVGNKGFLALSGEIDLLFGLFIAIVHTYWDWSYVGIITIIGYLLIFKGILRLGYPEKVKKFYSKMSDQGLIISLTIMLIVGAYLTYMGFRA